MKKILLCLTFIVCCGLFVEAQMQEKWKAEAGSAIKWNKFSPDGSLICGTTGGKTVAMDASTGNKIWEKSFEYGAFSILPNTSYVYWENENSGIKILDPINGNIVCDSKALGVSDINSYYPVRSGNGFLLYTKMGDKEQFWMVNLNDGSLRWKREFDFAKKKSIAGISIEMAEDASKMVLHCDPIGDGKGGVFVAFHDRIMNIDKDGNTVWDIEYPSQFGDQKGFFKSSGVDFHNIIPDQTGKFLYVFSGAYMSCHRRTDGGLAWTKPVKVFAPVENIIFEKEGMTLIPKPKTAMQKAYINSIDYATGTPKFGEKSLRVKGGFVQSSFCSKGMVFITKSFMNNSYFFNIIDTKSGKFELEKPLKIFEGPYKISEVKGGILITSEHGANLYNYQTKKMSIDNQLKVGKGAKLCRFDRKGLSYLYSSTKGNVFTLNHFNLKVKQLNKEKIELKGGDSADGITEFEDGFVIYSAQNIVKLDWDGNIKFQKYYKAPGAGTKAILKASFSMLGGLAQMAASAAVATSYDAAATSAQNGMKAMDQQADEMVASGEMTAADYATWKRDSKEMNQLLDESKDEVNKEMANVAAMGFVNSLEAGVEIGRVSKRFKNSKATKKYVVLMTNNKEQGGVGLAIVSKIDGEIKGFIPMKQSRTGTSYNIDPATNYLYWMPTMDSNVKSKRYPNIDIMQKSGTVLSYDLNAL